MRVDAIFVKSGPDPLKQRVLHGRVVGHVLHRRRHARQRLGAGVARRRREVAGHAGRGVRDLQGGVVLDEERVVLLRVLLPHGALVQDGGDLLAVRQRVRQALECLGDEDAGGAAVRVGVFEQGQAGLGRYKLSFEHKASRSFVSTGIV